MADTELVYCLKCKKKTGQKDAQVVTMKNGKPARQGRCNVCGTRTNLILSAAAAATAETKA